MVGSGLQPSSPLQILPPCHQACKVSLKFNNWLGNEVAPGQHSVRVTERLSWVGAWSLRRCHLRVTDRTQAQLTVKEVHKGGTGPGSESKFAILRNAKCFLSPVKFYEICNKIWKPIGDFFNRCCLIVMSWLFVSRTMFPHLCNSQNNPAQCSDKHRPMRASDYRTQSRLGLLQSAKPRFHLSRLLQLLNSSVWDSRQYIWNASTPVGIQALFH